MKNHILYTIDCNYIPYMLASIYSLIENSRLEGLKIHIITENFTRENYDSINNFFQNYPQVEYAFYPLEEFDIAKYSIPNWHGTQSANARLFFADILGSQTKQMNHLLYLDSDTVVVDELSSLKNYQDDLYASKDGTLRSYAKKLNNLSCYYNTGVIYLNVQRWLEDNYQDKIIDTIRSASITLSYPDQDLFNCAFQDSITSLPAAYNMSPYAYLFDGLLEKIYYNKKRRFIDYQEIRLQKEHPKILHSYGFASIKPWASTFNPLHEQYMKYLLAVDPNFIPPELESYQKLITKLPHLYYFLLLSREYVPEVIGEKMKALSLHFHNKQK